MQKNRKNNRGLRVVNVSVSLALQIVNQLKSPKDLSITLSRNRFFKTNHVFRT